ncbi:AAA family ATPase [Anaerolineales bacterium HSG25]|nr:AAA family ATPase [Anaerolineales bacterium HSG25]
MLEILTYQIEETIYESPITLVYRARRKQDNHAVILKMLRADYPSLENLARYQREYQINQILALDNIIKSYELEKYHNILILVSEDTGGQSLRQLMDKASLSLDAILTIAIQLTHVLGEIHAHHIIHQDISPTNIVVTTPTDMVPNQKEHATKWLVKLIDFGSATISGEDDNPPPIHLIEQSLAYISPEQTGRLNRQVDYRTDFYSLGITFYELLTDQLPFPTTDRLELVHSHIAKQPLPPHELIPETPLAVSEIIMKLLAKNPADRYQSAYGLKMDLVHCLHEWRNKGDIDPFPLGRHSISDEFNVPDKLYGRTEEVALFATIFERVKLGGRETLVVTGYDGVGKSSFVQEAYHQTINNQPIIRGQGYFITGRCEQFQRNVPYSPLVAAFTDLVQQLLTESIPQLQQWKQLLLPALENKGQVIIEVIPELTQIIGPQPALPKLEPAETQNRFNRIFQKFIRVFCRPDQPLVIFLDDLHWVDNATLRLLNLIMADTDWHAGGELEHLLLVVAYRDVDLPPNGSLNLMLDSLHEAEVNVEQIELNLLKVEQITDLIAETVHRNREEVIPLAELVVAKTEGNPLFVNEFLKLLRQKQLLTFTHPFAPQHEVSVAPQQAGWHWDLTQIETLNITDNVVGFVLENLQTLPRQTQHALQLAACIGNEFDTQTLAYLLGQSSTETNDDLQIALDENLIFQVTHTPNNARYKFLHDRVHQAAYQMLDSMTRQVWHLQIGQLWLHNHISEKRPDYIFELVDQLNQGSALINSTQEKVELARLNLSAAKKAKHATAYNTAQQYLVAALSLLPHDAWTVDYALTLVLYEERAKIEHLRGDFEASEQFIQLVLEHAEQPLDQVEAYNLLIVQYTLLGQYAEAIQIGRQGLALFEVVLPQYNLPDTIEAELAQVSDSLAGREVMSLVDEPEMTDPTQIATLKLLTNTAAAAYNLNQDLLTVIVAKSVNLSLQHGHIPQTTSNYAIYGMLIGSVFGDYQTGYEFGLLALRLSEKFNHLAYQCNAANSLANHVNHWTQHIKQAEKINDRGYQAGIEVGELQYSGYILMYKVLNAFIQGKILDTIETNIPHYISFVTKTKNQLSIDVIQACQLPIKNLTEQTPHPESFDCPTLSESEFLEHCQHQHSFQAICHYQILKAQLLYMYDQPAAALKAISEAEELLTFILGIITVAEYNFYHSLALAARYTEVSPKVQALYWDTLERNQTQMRLWATNSPDNFQHKYLLVSAEMARLRGHSLKAINLYDEAIESAREHGFIQNEALANELAGKFWVSRNKADFARLYLTKAYYGYELWGATRKLSLMSELYPYLRLKKQPAITSNGDSSIADQGAVLDLATVIQASQTISGEIVTDKLLSKLMRIAVQNAGAQIGYLLLEEDGQLVIEAAQTLDRRDIMVLQSQPLTDSDDLPTAIIHYVVRTQKSVVLDDASHEGRFTRDPYIVTHQPLSILCTPLISQGRFMGVLYLENNLTSGAFTPDRLQVLQLLSAQAAISLGNARLYNDLAHNALKYRTLFEDSRDAIFVSDLQGYIIEANQAMLDLFDYSAEELKQINISSIYVNPDDQQKFKTVITQRGSVRDFEVTFYAKDGLEMECLLTATAQYDDEGQMIAYQGVVRDITERKKTEMLMSEYNRILEQAVSARTSELTEALDSLRATQTQLVEAEKMAALGGLVAGIAHEINTPISVGVTAASYLEEQTSDILGRYKTGKMKRSSFEEYLNIADQSSTMILTNLNRAVELIKSFKQVAVDQSSEERRFFDVKSYLDEILLSLKPKIKHTKHTVTVHGPDNLMLDSYPGDFAQIVTNLIMNSLVHAYEPDDQGHMTFEFYAAEEHLHFEYRDDGIGIPDENLHRIFEPFFSTKWGQGGSGLGLHIIYNLVTQRLGGAIRCQSELGSGTKFVIEIPMGAERNS